MKKTIAISFLQTLGLSFLSAVFMLSCSGNDTPPKAFGAVPTADQIKWQQMEYYMFIHFGPNTFTDVEWGDGKEDPKVFNPTNLDCRQWASTAKAAGMRGIIITAKHHDGFCLWPSKYSTHTVRETLWKDGKGDILRELSDACKEYDLKFGVYLSPWDQNHPSYGTPEYNQIFANTLTEVLTDYGDVFEQWFDGANGEGPNGKKQVYDWDLFHKTVYDNQPHAVIFSDVGPGCRWMGNEKGIAGETNWSTLNIKGFGPGLSAPPTDTLNRGNMHGEAWVPAETDVSIRPGWFYSPATDDKVKTIEQLVDIYYTSIGRNSNLLLNVPPSREGRIHINDSIRLMEFRKAIDAMYVNDLTLNAKVKATHTRGNSSKFTSSNVLDTDFDIYWATDDDVTASAIELEWESEQTFNQLLLQEYTPLGQRIAKFSVETWDDTANNWKTVAKATTIGYKRILKLPLLTTKKLKIAIHESLACPTISNIGVYNVVDRKDESFNESKAYFSSNSSEKWVVESPKGEQIKQLIDRNPQTAVHLDKMEPIVINLGETILLKGFTYLPTNNGAASHITRYNFYASKDGKEWAAIKKTSVFNNIKNNPVQQNVIFEKPIDARYIKLEPLEITQEGLGYDVVEIDIIK